MQRLGCIKKLCMFGEQQVVHGGGCTGQTGSYYKRWVGREALSKE